MTGRVRLEVDVVNVPPIKFVRILGGYEVVPFEVIVWGEAFWFSLMWRKDFGVCQGQSINALGTPTHVSFRGTQTHSRHLVKQLQRRSRLKFNYYRTKVRKLEQVG